MTYFFVAAESALLQASEADSTPLHFALRNRHRRTEKAAPTQLPSNAGISESRV